MALKTTSREVDGASVVALHGRIVLGDERSALCEKLKNLIAEGKKKIVLNMHHIEHIDGSRRYCTCAIRKHPRSPVFQYRKTKSSRNNRVTLQGIAEQTVKSGTESSISLGRGSFSFHATTSAHIRKHLIRFMWDERKEGRLHQAQWIHVHQYGRLRDFLQLKIRHRAAEHPGQQRALRRL